MRWITSISTVMEMVIKGLLLAILLVVGLVLGVGLWRSWSSNAQGITIHSFTETGADTLGDKSKNVGEDIADVLESEILQIAQFHTLINPWGSPKELPSLQMTGPQTIQRVGGAIKLAGIELPVEMVIEIFKAVFARPRTQYTITGSFQKVSSDTETAVQEPENTEKDDCPKPPSDTETAVKASENTAKDDCLRFPPGLGTRVQLIVRLESDGRMLKRWSCKSLITKNAEHNAEIPSYLEQHLREIAYEIMWIVLDKVEANSLKNFQCFIRGVELFRQYKDKQKFFSEAENTLLNVIYHNKTSARGYFYLGNLYNWRAYHENNEVSASEHRNKARQMYEATGTKETANSGEALALSKFGIGLVYYRHYSKEMKDFKENKSGKAPDTKLLDNAYINFTSSWEKDKKFYFSRTGMALVNKAKAEITKEDSKEIKRYIEESIKEFKYAKGISQELKDIDSVKWLDRQIRDLEFKKREFEAEVAAQDSKRP